MAFLPSAAVKLSGLHSCQCGRGATGRNSQPTAAASKHIPAIAASLRLSLGRDTTDEEIDYVLKTLPEVVRKLRMMSPLTPSGYAGL